MKKTFSNILKASFVLTTVGILMDGDVVKTTMLTRFMEFSLIMGIITLIISAFYFPVAYFLKSRSSATS